MGHYSEDGLWWWDGSRWLPTPPPGWPPQDTVGTGTGGATRVTGATPATEAELFATGDQPVAPADDLELLDPPRLAAGDLPNHVAHVPGKPTTQLPTVAVGWGWVARRVVRWHLLHFHEIQTVALVPSLRWTGEAEGGDARDALPDLALRTFMGRTIRIEAAQMTSAARKDLLSQLPMSAHVTPLAEAFLEEGQLPGVWQQRLESFGPR